ncbi:MAG: cyclopropane-fatty-acyl-phospholipid synthase family protein [Thiohalomonadaceae bacterium]
MTTHRWMTALAFGGLLAAGVSTAQYPTLDVPYVPSPDTVVDGMLRLAQVGPGDVVYDLGSGDGRIVIAAAQRYGARGVGIDIDPDRIRESNEKALEAGVDNQVRFIQGDLFEADIRPATVVTLYLLSSVNEEIRPRLLHQLRPGTRVVSHAFDMGDWQPDARTVVDGAEIFLWVVPAQAGGQWLAVVQSTTGTQEFSMSLQQEFQQLAGMAVLEGAHMILEGGQVQGEQLELVLDDGNGNQRRLRGRIDGDNISGWVYAAGASEPSGRWQATRVGYEQTGQMPTGG